MRLPMLERFALRNSFRASSIRLRRASPTAQSLTFWPPWTHWPAAHLPRPPQPTRPTRMMSLELAWTAGAAASAAALPVTAAVFKKSRRVVMRKLLSIIRAFAGHFRLKPLQIFLLLDRAHNSKTDKIGVGHPPDALRLLRVALEPFLVGAATRGAAALGRRIGPRAAADHVGITLLVRHQHRRQAHLVERKLRVIVLAVVVDAPLRDIA